MTSEGRGRPSSRAAWYRFTIRTPLGRIPAVVLAAFVLAAQAGAGTGVVAIGDFGVGGTTERRMGAAVERFASARPVHALVTLGDNDYTERPRAFARNWRDAFGWTAERGLVVAGTLGNHDVRVDRGRYEFAALGMPRRFYERRVGEVGLFLVDSTSFGTRQAAWLDGALAASDALWKVVAFHHPLFTCGAYRGDGRLRRLLLPVLARHGVDLVLAGHDHNYQRFAPRRGVPFVVHGGGGAGLYPVASCPRWYPDRLAARSARGWVYLRATPDELRVRAVSPGGRVLDRAVIYP